MDPTQIPAAVNAASGAIGGVIANALMFPLDVATVRLQVASEADGYESLAGTFRKILRKEGPQAFYEGVVSDSSATMVQAFLYFFAYDFVRNRRLHQIERATGRLPRTLSTPEELLVGSAAGIFCKFFTAPINNYVVLKQADHSIGDNNTSLRKLPAHKALAQIYKAKGITGFWAGYKATILLSVNPSLTYYFFQFLTARIVPRHRRHHPKALELFLAAAIAKSLATMITYPIILTKTRTQVADPTSEPAYRAIWRLVRHRGPQVLYDGASGQVLKGFFTQGFTMMSKDVIARTLMIIYVRGVLRRRGSLGRKRA